MTGGWRLRGRGVCKINEADARILPCLAPLKRPQVAGVLPDAERVRRDGDTIRHLWGSELLYAPSEPGQDPRHGDTIDALWNLFALTPEGRGTDWYPELG